MSVAVGELPGFASVSDANVCNWYFAVFVLTAVGVALVLLKSLPPALFAKTSVMTKVVSLFAVLVMTGYSLAYAGFQFTMCKRTLAV